MTSEQDNTRGRKRSAKLDFFYLDGDWIRDTRIRKLKGREAGFRNNGIVVYLLLLTEIYTGKKGYFLEWDESTMMDVADIAGIKTTTVAEIVKYCCAIGLFDKDLCTRDKVLSSKSIQARWSVAMQKMKRKEFIPEEYNLFKDDAEFLKWTEKHDRENYETDAEVQKSGINSEEKAISSEEIGINAEEIETREEKKRREERRTLEIINNFSFSSTECVVQEDLKAVFDAFDNEWKPLMWAWIEYKKQVEPIKKPENLKGLYTRLRGYSGENLKVARWLVAYAMQRGWKGFRNPKESNYNPDYDVRQPEVFSDEKPEARRKQFVKPTLDEVANYCSGRNNEIDAQLWIDHYESVGWLVGKNKLPMKDWQAAVRTWERNGISKKTSFRKTNMSNYQQENKNDERKF